MTMKKNACLTLLKLLLLTLLSFVNAAAWSQTDSHVAGHVLDADTKEHLPFINVQIQGTAIGTTTDESGHYLLKRLPAGKHTLVFSMVGYDTEEREILVTRDTTIVLNIMMREEIEKHHATLGVSNSRTCEIGLCFHGGISYINVAALVNRCATRKSSTQP